MILGGATYSVGVRRVIDVSYIDMTSAFRRLDGKAVKSPAGFGWG
jgi:hypothetical protein